MSWHTSGMEKAKKVQEQIAKGYRPEFWIKNPGESAFIIFLDEEPLNFHQHSVKVRGQLKKYTCRRDRCPLCAVDNPRYISVFRIIDLREWQDKAGKTRKNEEKYYEVGSRLFPQIERLLKKGKLMNSVIEVVRNGTGQSTTYVLTHERELRKSPPAPKLNPLKDYEPRSEGELRTVAEILGADFRDDSDYREEPAPPRRGGGRDKNALRDYYEEGEEDGGERSYGEDAPDYGSDHDGDYDDDQDGEEDPPPTSGRRRRRQEPEDDDLPY